VDAVVVTGDIADHGLAPEYEEARNLLGTRHRVLLCPGNHDARGAYRQVLLVAFHHPPVAVHSPFIDAIRLQREQCLADLLHRHARVAAVLCGHAHTAAASSFAGRPLLIAPGVASTLRLPWEGAGDIDGAMPPAIAFHVLGDDGRLTTHYRVLP
jgi:Icc protein